MSASSKSGSGPKRSAWELFNVDSDFSQANDLAAANPEKLRELQDLWRVEAAKYNGLPLDWSGAGVHFTTRRPGHSSPIREKVTVELKAK